MTPDWVREFMSQHHDELVALRHHLHAHPELSHQEFATTELIAERLRVAGLEPRLLSAGTGLICDIGRSNGDGRMVALRADIDALSMVDESDAPYCSRVPGVAHGCGHDLHTVVVLGAGLALAASLGDRSAGSSLGGVRLIFEPAEESVPGGAVDVIADGGLEGVGSIYGFHADPKIPVGDVGVRSGALTSAADIVEVTLRGPGGHTARPGSTVDLVSVAARVASVLPGRVAQRVAGSGSELSLVFGAIQAGDAANVIPSTALLRGSVRTPDRDLWTQAEEVVSEELARLVADSGAELSCSYRRGVPPVVNSENEAELARVAVGRALGIARVVEPPRSLGGDSFGWYQERVPGCYMRLGVHDPADEQMLDLHSGAFDVDDRAIDIGVRVLLELIAGSA